MPFSRTSSALQAVRSYRPRSVVAKGFKPAAVLVPIHERAGEHYLTLIERAATLRSHGGEIAFPGGNVTAEDKDSLAAALREFQEEIGIDPENVQIIGQLDEVTVGSQYLVTPFVGIVISPFQISPNKEEVSSVISVPVSALLHGDCFTTEFRADERPRIIYHFRYEGLDIWGRHCEHSQAVTGGGLWVSGKRKTGLAGLPVRGGLTKVSREAVCGKARRPRLPDAARVQLGQSVQAARQPRRPRRSQFPTGTFEAFSRL